MPQVIRHFDGVRWSREEIVASQLTDVHGVDRDHVWAVGMNVILRLENGRWVEQDIAEATRHDPPRTCFDDTSLSAVWALSPNDVWAVGGFSTPDGLAAGLILHFDGQRWERQPTDASDGFFGVWAAAHDDAWAVGASGLAYHYDGKSWTRSDAQTQEYLLAVWGSGARDVWIAGYAGVRSRFDGERWTEQQTPFAAQAISALTGRSGSDVWALAQRLDLPQRDQQLMHWDGAAWRDEPVTDEPIGDLWLSPGGTLWSAGDEVVRRR